MIEKIPQENIENVELSTTEKLRTRLLSLTTHLKGPKFITLIILFMTIVLISIALNFMAGNNKDNVVTPPELQSSTPSPDASVDPSTENITQRVKFYSDKLNSIKNFSEDLKKPIVDLDISFK